MSSEQTQQTDDPSGDGWRDVEPDELLQAGDMYPIGERWEPTASVGAKARVCGNGYRRRIEQPQPNPDDPRGDGWRDLGLDEPIEQGDVYTPDGYNWLESDSIGRRPIEFPNRLEYPHLRYRRRIEPQQVSDSEPETMEQLRDEVATLTFELMAERDSGMIALQQLREQVATLTRERDQYRNQLAGAIEHSKAPEAQAKLVDRLQTWLRPVLEVVAENPEDSVALALAVLADMPAIAARLIEE